MYKVASENAQRRVSRVDMAEIAARTPEEVSVEDEWLAARAAIAKIDATLKSDKSHPERAALIARKLKLQSRVSELKAVLNKAFKDRGGEIARAFVTIAKETLPTWQFNSIIDKAKKIAAEE